MKKWFFKLISSYKIPTRISFKYKFIGKNSDNLYTVNEEKEFNLPIESKFINRDESYAWWHVACEIEDALKDEIHKNEKRLLKEARLEKYISRDDEERITGDYIVAVRCDVDISGWRLLTFEEYIEMRKRMEEQK